MYGRHGSTCCAGWLFVLCRTDYVPVQLPFGYLTGNYVNPKLRRDEFIIRQFGDSGQFTQISSLFGDTQGRDASGFYKRGHAAAMLLTNESQSPLPTTPRGLQMPHGAARNDPASPRAVTMSGRRDASSTARDQLPHQGAEKKCCVIQ